MAKTIFIDGNPSQGILGTIVNALFLNKIFNHRHDGADADGSAPINYAADTGAADAYAIALTPALTAHVPGMPIVFKAAHANTGASTIAINGMATVPIKDTAGAALVADAIKAGALVMVIYDTVNYQVMNLDPQSDVPIGAEMLWPIDTPPPTRWFEEDGTSLVRTTYQGLFNIIGTGYGAVDSSHFNLPSPRGRHIRIWAHGQATDPDRASRTAPTAPGATIQAGDHNGTDQPDENRLHYHTVPTLAAGAGGGSNRDIYGGAGDTSTLGSGGNESRGVNTNRMLIIKAY
ncbi:MAG: phage tail protein [Deltaproteobacteria bacterium]|nr:phage tail protein [Deltaproteobacteria bacterium]